MKSLLPFPVLLLAIGCLSQPQASRIDVPTEAPHGTKDDSYAVLSDPPDTILDEMASRYSGNNKQWRSEWKEDNSSIPIDGQRALRLLEIAGYADVVCHPIEYPLRVATLDYIKANIDSSGVRDSLKWILTSNKCGLPLEEPGDKTGDFKGVRVEAMKIRLTEYVNELLQSYEPVSGEVEVPRLGRIRLPDGKWTIEHNYLPTRESKLPDCFVFRKIGDRLERVAFIRYRPEIAQKRAYMYADSIADSVRFGIPSFLNSDFVTHARTEYEIEQLNTPKDWNESDLELTYVYTSKNEAPWMSHSYIRLKSNWVIVGIHSSPFAIAPDTIRQLRDASNILLPSD